MAPKDSAAPCNGLQSRDPHQSIWHRATATKADAPKPDNEPPAVTANKRAAMAFGLDPSRPATTDTQRATARADGEKARLRTIKAAFGVSAPATSDAGHHQTSNLCRAYGLRNDK